MWQAPKVRLHKSNSLGLTHFSYFASQMTAAGRHSERPQRCSVPLQTRMSHLSKGLIWHSDSLWEQLGRTAEGPFLLSSSFSSFLKVKSRSCPSRTTPCMLYPSILGKSTFIITGTYRPGNLAGRYQKSWGLKSQHVEGRDKEREEPEEARGRGDECQVLRALVQFRPVDNILHVLFRGSWLLTQKSCTSFGCGEKCWRDCL